MKVGTAEGNREAGTVIGHWGTRGDVFESKFGHLKLEPTLFQKFISFQRLRSRFITYDDVLCFKLSILSLNPSLFHYNMSSCGQSSG